MSNADADADADTGVSGDDTQERTVDRALAGGGSLTATVTHPDGQRGRSLVAKIEAAVEAVNAQYFNRAPRRRLGTEAPLKHRTELRPIREAIDAANARPSVAKNIDGELGYEITEPLYPDEYSHYVDVSDVAVGDRANAFLHAQAELCQRGYAINSVRTDDEGNLTRFHIVSLSWVYSARATDTDSDDE